MTVRWGGGVLAAALLLGATACASESSPAAEPSPKPAASTPAPEPSQTPEPEPIETVTAVVVHPTTFDLVDEAGAVVESFGYLDPADEAVAALTTVFGEDAVAEDWDGSNHFPPATTHSWAGFTLIEQRLTGEWTELIPEPSYDRPRVALRIETDRFGDVAIRTGLGTQVGAPWAGIAIDPAIDPALWTCSGTALEVPADTAVETGTPTVAAGESDAGTVERIVAPAPIADGCA